MRVYGPNGMGAVATAAGARRSAGKTFRLDESDASHATSQNAAPRGVGGIDALIALQGLDEATQRRRRALHRGRGALDALEALKLGLLSGRLEGATLARLNATLVDLAEPSGDPRLDAILAEIGLRVSVELAKMSVPNLS